MVTFGAGLNRWTADHGALFPDAVVVSVDVDPAAIGARWPVAAADPFAGLAVESTADRIDPRAFIRICAGRLPRERTTVVGVGHFGGWPNLLLDSAATDRSFVAPWEFGSIGVGLPFAVGAAVGRPDRPVVAFEGDGSLLTGLGELDTLARVGAPVLLVLLDDAAYGAEVRNGTSPRWPARSGCRRGPSPTRRARRPPSTRCCR
ncbi:thiamine pyrophosphate-dependent enzyme [Verrucosispora sioxanthis]|uniref:thiamine pyrophosphate-dependent enzyme n=1 Tax=Verrucosispora sioxanthis TaxID=2499994 RepID=UPI00281570BD|nr:thiamine pyrophosphate-dependent enzyme [Verrucosispora sioxanthis]